MADEPRLLKRDNHERALRHALWIALLHAQELGLHEIEHQITSVLVHVDAVREASAADDETVTL